MVAERPIVAGQRTITHQPTGRDGERERGTVDNPVFKDSNWRGATVQQVIELMDYFLGPIAADDYQIVE